MSGMSHLRVSPGAEMLKFLCDRMAFAIDPLAVSRAPC